MCAQCDRATLLAVIDGAHQWRAGIPGWHAIPTQLHSEIHCDLDWADAGLARDQCGMGGSCQHNHHGQLAGLARAGIWLAAQLMDVIENACLTMAPQHGSGLVVILDQLVRQQTAVPSEPCERHQAPAEGA